MSLFGKGVTAESSVSERTEERAKIKPSPKTEIEKKFIRSALSMNLFLKALSLRLDNKSELIINWERILNPGLLLSHIYFFLQNT